MPLRKKALLIVGLTLAGLILAVVATTHLSLNKTYTALEEAAVRRNVDRATNALANELASLSNTTNDYAGWDDTYRFIKDRNEAYITSNLTDDTFAKQRLNAMIFADERGRIVHARAYDPAHHEDRILEELQAYLAADPWLVRHDSTESDKKGLILLPLGLMLVASRPILTSLYEGPIRGALIMARILDAQELARLSDLTQLRIAVEPIGGESFPDGRTARVEVRPLNQRTVAGIMTLRDIRNRPIREIKVLMDREIFRQGQLSRVYLIGWLLLAGIVFAVVLLLILERLILSRVEVLAASVQAVAAGRDPAVRIPVQGRDELAGLALAINSMLENLDATQKELAASESGFRNLAQELAQIIEFLPDPTLVISRDGKVISWNLAMEDLTGLKKQDIIGRGDYAYAVPFYGKPRPVLADLVLTADSEGGTAGYTAFKREGNIVTAEVYAPMILGGKGAHLLLKASALYDGAGNPIGAIESVRDITEQKQIEERLRYLSLRDQLTGLYNRTYFEQAMTDLDRRSGSSGLILCDIDGLKLINDTLGHNGGDELLRMAAAAIQQALEDGDTASRIGGDEFAILMPGGTEADVKQRCRKIAAAISAANAGHPHLPLSISLGGAAGSQGMEALFKEADDRVYRDKLRHDRGKRRAFVKALLKAIEARGTKTGGRPYRKVHGPSRAIAELIRRAGWQFDPELVGLFLRAIRADRPDRRGKDSA